ncbi:hypothetical protein OG866_44430 [Streptomyces sp. NBC_00663]|uniref:hypothetical protein n=1 Tax=Streptomyces sp. NBC_00663 TaxID=2975801 RepID=UPI002E3042B4|nr:hypothetical protein [Streptomyces sp. NBC_00663]
MTGDRFTQIANGLLRDPQLSFRAKGIFGYLSTHRAGWEITLADLVEVGPDGRDAVRAGLGELQARGYLVRAQLRRTAGTLGESVYCLTDTLATGDTRPRAATASAPSPAATPGTWAGIRRNVVAVDQFAQIANRLFRDPRLSFKAKGLFGLISTHRDGWRITVADLARHSRNGAVVVRSGLTELERHGFLVRERTRHEDGTLGGTVYVITDQPVPQPCRSQPVSGFPPVDEPTSAHQPTKNTIVKKTNQQNTNPLPPCPRGDNARGPSAEMPEGRAAPAAPVLAPGTRLLLSIGSAHPELLLQEKALHDQGGVVTAMLDAGWSTGQLRHVITSRPLPGRIRTSVDAIVAARLRSAQLYPPPAANSHPTDRDEAVRTPQPSTASAADRTVDEAIAYRALVECSGCGTPATAPGQDLCPACLGWPLCRTCPGPTPRRAHPDGDGCCSTCASALTTTGLLEASPS